MHPKSSDGLIKRPRTRILAANGILPAWHSPPIKRVYDPSLSLSPGICAFSIARFSSSVAIFRDSFALKILSAASVIAIRVFRTERK